MDHFRRIDLCVCVSLLLAACVAPSVAAEPPITSVAFSPDGATLLACSQRGAVKFAWPQLTRQARLDTAMPNLHAAVFSPNGERVAIGGGAPAESGSVQIFRWPAAKLLSQLAGHTDSVMALTWIDDRTLAVGSLDHRVTIWNTDDGSQLQTLRGHSQGVTALTFLAKDQLLISGSIDQSLRVWDLASGDLVRSLPNHTKAVSGLTARPVNAGLPVVTSISADKTVRLWQPTIGRMVRFARLTSSPLDVAWMPGGESIVVCCVDGNAYRIDPVTVAVSAPMAAIKGWAYALAVHPSDGTFVVGGDKGRLERIKLDVPASASQR